MMNETIDDPSNNVHVSLLYCIDRPYLHLSWGGPIFAYSRAAVDVILTIGIITVNMALILAIFFYRRKYRGTAKIYNSGTSMKFVQMLAFSDVLVGLLTPMYLFPHYFCDIEEKIRSVQVLCMLKFFATMFAGVMSNLSLISIAVDRYIAIEYTLKYRMIMTHRYDAVCHMMIIGQVVFTLSAGSVLFFWNNWTPGSYCDLEDVVPYTYFLTLGIICHSVILVMVIGVHYQMHRKASECASRRNIMELRVSRETSNSIKSAKVFLLVAGVYVVCWTPYSVCLMIRILQIYDTPLVDFMYQLLFPLSYANSLLNPFIYAWKNSEIQNALVWSIRRRSSSI